MSWLAIAVGLVVMVSDRTVAHSTGLCNKSTALMLFLDAYR
jgi:hypothetical protein